MNRGFCDRQLKMLASPLDEARVQRREQEGRTLFYIEGWYALAEANAIFGYDGWDRETVYFEKLFERSRGESTNCGYAARVRITVRARGRQIVREGTGVGRALANCADAHERAMKAAETDATKRALATFGSRFGLLLYDKEQRALAQRPRGSVARGDGQSDGIAGSAAVSDEADALVLVAPDGQSWKVGSPEAFCSGLRQMIEATSGFEDLDRLWRANQAGLSRLRETPTLTTSRGEHFGDVLARLMVKRTRQLVTKPTDPKADIEAADISGDDAKSAALNLAEGESFMPGSPQAGMSSVAGSTDGASQKNTGSTAAANMAPKVRRQTPLISSGVTDRRQCVAGSSPEIRTNEPLSQRASQERRRSSHPTAAAPPSTGSGIVEASPSSNSAQAATAPIGPGAGVPEDHFHPTKDNGHQTEGITAAQSSQTLQDSPNRSEPPERVHPSIRPFVPVPPYPLRGILQKMSLPREVAGGAVSKRRDVAAPDQDRSPQNGGPGAIGGNEIVGVEGLAKPGGRAEAPVPPANQPTRRSQIRGGFSVDKSVLMIPSERRLRSKAHLVMVAGKPCAVCEATPCHAHHVTYAQPRGLSLKVSDEYTVPLCVAHHNEVHASGKEASWWRSQRIDPLILARRLWLETTGGEAIV